MFDIYLFGSLEKEKKKQKTKKKLECKHVQNRSEFITTRTHRILIRTKQVLSRPPPEIIKRLNSKAKQIYIHTKETEKN